MEAAPARLPPDLPDSREFPTGVGVPGSSREFPTPEISLPGNWPTIVLIGDSESNVAIDPAIGGYGVADIYLGEFSPHMGADAISQFAEQNGWFASVRPRARRREPHALFERRGRVF